MSILPCCTPDSKCCLQWLEQHLEGIDRCLTPWLVVSMHRPMYVVHPHKSNRIVAGKKAPVLLRHAGFVYAGCHPLLLCLRQA